MSDYAKMTLDAQQDLAAKISAIIKENGMDLPVETLRQERCSLGETEVVSMKKMRVVKQLPSYVENIEILAMNKELSNLTEGIENVEINITVKP